MYAPFQDRVHYVAISAADRHPALRYAATIHHGIPIDEFTFDATGSDDLPASPPLAPDRQDRERVDSRRDVPVWSGGLAMVLLIVCLGGEVLVRRRVGLA